MGDIFLKLLNMSIAASWLILAVLLLRLLLRRTPKWLSCLLWGIVAIRLLCPISIESIYSLVPSAETVQSSTVADGQIHAYIPSIDSGMPVVNNTVNPILSEAFAYEEEDSVAPLQVYTYIAGIVWCVGAFLMLAYAIVSHLRIRHMVKEAVCCEGNIYLCDAVVSPFILGMLKPHIYLPSGMGVERENSADTICTAQSSHYVIAHEQAHLKRKDHWWKPLGYLLLSVYWFAPLCWVAYVLFCKDIELACDEKVIRDMTLHEKKEYSKALLSCSRQGRMVLSCPLAFGEISVKERVKSVLAYKKTAVWILAAAIVACVIVGVCFLTNPLKEYQVRVTIPAGCTEQFSYSEEEICPKSGTITFYAGEGLGDTEILLLPVEDKEGNTNGETDAYGPTYMTPGMAVKFEVEKGVWYKIGVNMQNRTEEDKKVYVSVKNVEVRIAAAAQPGQTGVNSVSAGQRGTESTGVGLTAAGQADAGQTGMGQTDTKTADAGSADGGSSQDDDVPLRYDLGDLDGNGENEFLLIAENQEHSIGDGHLSFYFNGESIYEYDDILMMSPGTARYIDLDRDGEREIFFTFYPYVNSMPLIEYAVLKQTNTGWKALEMIHGETMLDNAFPISCRHGSGENTFVLTCEGTDRQVVYDYRAYYEYCIREYQESSMGSGQYAEILEKQYGEGDDFGSVAAWGIWEIESGAYEGRNCLIATHGLQGPLGKWDMIGEVDIYFDYNKEGLVNILDMEFRDSLSASDREEDSLSAGVEGRGGMQ